LALPADDPVEKAGSRHTRDVVPHRHVRLEFGVDLQKEEHRPQQRSGVRLEVVVGIHRDLLSTEELEEPTQLGIVESTLLIVKDRVPVRGHAARLGRKPLLKRQLLATVANEVPVRGVGTIDGLPQHRDQLRVRDVMTDPLGCLRGIQVDVGRFPGSSSVAGLLE
jgi:hypothetical protein